MGYNEIIDIVGDIYNNALIDWEIKQLEIIE